MHTEGFLFVSLMGAQVFSFLFFYWGSLPYIFSDFVCWIWFSFFFLTCLPSPVSSISYLVACFPFFWHSHSLLQPTFTASPLKAFVSWGLVLLLGDLPTLPYQFFCLFHFLVALLFTDIPTLSYISSTSSFVPWSLTFFPLTHCHFHCLTASPSSVAVHVKGNGTERRSWGLATV